MTENKYIVDSNIQEDIKTDSAIVTDIKVSKIKYDDENIVGNIITDTLEKSDKSHIKIESKNKNIAKSKFEDI